MSTHCNIGYKKDGKYYYTYCHFDGYLSGVGEFLIKDFNSEELAIKLIDKGAMNNPYESLYPEEWDWEDCIPKITSEINDTRLYFHTYIWVNGSWIYSYEKDEWNNLEKILKAREK